MKDNGGISNFLALSGGLGESGFGKMVRLQFSYPPRCYKQLSRVIHQTKCTLNNTLLQPGNNEGMFSASHEDGVGIVQSVGLILVRSCQIIARLLLSIINIQQCTLFTNKMCQRLGNSEVFWIASRPELALLGRAVPQSCDSGMEVR